MIFFLLVGAILAALGLFGAAHARLAHHRLHARRLRASRVKVHPAGAFFVTHSSTIRYSLRIIMKIGRGWTVRLRRSRMAQEPKRRSRTWHFLSGRTSLPKRRGPR